MLPPPPLTHTPPTSVADSSWESRCTARLSEHDHERYPIRVEAVDCRIVARPPGAPQITRRISALSEGRRRPVLGARVPASMPASLGAIWTTRRFAFDGGGRLASVVGNGRGSCADFTIRQLVRLITRPQCKRRDRGLFAQTFSWRTALIEGESGSSEGPLALI